MTSEKDDNERARIVVTVPMRPSHFESALAGLNDSGVLTETMETLLHLSRRAVGRLMVVSPFLDDDGLDWVLSLFEATPAADRGLICRHADQLTHLTMAGAWQQSASELTSIFASGHWETDEAAWRRLFMRRLFLPTRLRPMSGPRTS